MCVPSRNFCPIASLDGNVVGKDGTVIVMLGTSLVPAVDELLCSSLIPIKPDLHNMSSASESHKPCYSILDQLLITLYTLPQALLMPGHNCARDSRGDLYVAVRDVKKHQSVKVQDADENDS